MFDKIISRRVFLTISAMTVASLALDWKKISAYAAKMGPRSNYPTVIIGAGLGGLCCGAYLAKQGVPVTIIEQHNKPGGYATSFDREGGKFTFEVSLHGTSVNNNATARILEDLGVLSRLQLVELQEVYRLKTPDMDISVPQKDPEAYIRLLTKHFPAEKDAIGRFVQQMLGLAEEVDRLHKKKGKFFKPIFPIQYRKMWKIRNKTLADLINDYVSDPRLKDTLAALWGYYGLPPSKLSGFYYANATGGYLKNGSYYIKQRSQDLSYELAEVIQKSGGQIIYETSVEKVMIKNGVVDGVLLSGGNVLPAKAVVSNASAIITFKKLLPPKALPAEYLKRLENYRPSLSTFIVWLGLNTELRGKIKGYSIHVSSGHGAEADHQSCLKGDIEHGSFSVTIYDNAFDGYSSPGTSTLMLLFLCGYEPWRRYEHDYKTGNKTAYYEEKNRWTDILIRRAEKMVVPGLSSLIGVKEAATPLTNWRYTGNTEGAIYGFEQSMKNSYMTRISNETPIKGLYLAGAWGNPGGGYPGVLRSGQLTFEKLMESWGGYLDRDAHR
jgi:prolycopene isomerase